MTDEGLLRKVAEILGWKPIEKKEGWAKGFWVRRHDGEVAYCFDPLNDWSDLGPLLQRYECSVWKDKGTGEWWCQIHDYQGKMQSMEGDEWLPRAILKAIVEAHGE